MKRRLLLLIALLAGAARAETGLVREYVQTNEIPQRVSETPLAVGANYETSVAPVFAGYIFTHWTMNVAGATRDTWGRAYDAVPYRLENRIDFTAHYLPADEDSDGDGVADGYEIYWYGNLAQGADSDTDGDGFTFAEELANGTNPLMAEGEEEGPIQIADGEMTLYNPNGYGRIVVRSDAEGLVTSRDETYRPGTAVTTGALSPTTSIFAYWLRNGEPCRDAWGRAVDEISFTLGEASEEFVAVGVADADARMKLYWYGTTDVAMDSDTDGDGRTFSEEIVAGTNPLMADADVEGPVQYGDGELTLYNPFDYQPAVMTTRNGGTVTTNSCEYLRPGTVVTTSVGSPSSSTFAYWTRNGEPCRDAWGRAIDQISFSMGTQVETLEAVQVANADDRQKLYWYGTTEVAMDSDTDGDGLTFAEEIAAGTNPLMADGDVEGPVQVADGRLLLYDPFGKLDACIATVEGYEGTYDGQAHGITVKVLRPTSGYTLRYGLSDSGPFSATMPTFKDVGTHVIWYELASNDYENDVDCGTVTITKGTIPGGGEEPGAGEIPEGGLSKFDATYMYDGEGHTIKTNELVAAFAAAMGDVFAVSYAVGESGGFIETALPWTDVAPVFTNAGSAVVWYKVTNPNYNDFVHAAKVTVTKRAMSAVSVSDPGVIDYTGAAITPSVTVRDGSPSIVKASDYTVSYADNIQPGTARIILTATADGNYTGTKTVPFTIRKTTFDIDDGTGGEGGKASSFSYAGVYDGQGHGIDVQIANPPAGTMIKYSLGQSDTAPGGTWSTVNPLSTNVCDNVIWYAVECAGYVSYTNNATVTITPRAVSVKSASKSKPYDGTPLKLTAGDISVSSGGGQGLPALPTGESFVYENLAERTDAGQTSATFTIAAGTGTKLTNYAITTEFGTLTVTKATWGGGEEPGTGEIPEGGLSKFDAVREYNGKGQTIDVEKLTEAFAEVVGNDFTVQYAEGESGGLGQPALPAWTTVAPTVKDVGSMIVWYKVTNPNFEDFVHAAKVTVVPKELTDEMVQPGEDAFFFDGADKKPTVDVVYEVDGQDICTTNDYTLVYGEKAAAGWWVTVTGKGNYSGTVTKIVPVLKRPVAPPLVTSKSYNGKTQKPTIPTDSRWTVVANPGGINVGEYTNVVLRLTNTTDYKWKGGAEEQTDITLIFKVTKANNGWSQYPDMKGWAYGQTPSEPAMGRARYGTVQVAYRKEGAAVSTETATRPELPGQYVARFYVEATDNFIGVTRDIAFEITGTAPGGDHTTTTPVPVPYKWLEPYLKQFGGDYETAANAKGRNGVSLWESYVAGLDPTDPTSQFTASIAIGTDGKPIITWKPALNGETAEGEGILKGERIYRICGKKDLSDATWTADIDPKGGVYRFYKITVELVK